MEDSSFVSCIDQGAGAVLGAPSSRKKLPPAVRLLTLLLLLVPLAAVGSVRAQQPLPADTAQADTTSQAPQGPPPEFAPPPTDRPLRGVVWRLPADTAQAARELRRIESAGVEAVRTPLLRDERLLSLADSLRLRLFQDLPAMYLPAGGVREALPPLKWELERALLAARRHPSARHFGLLNRSDTSVPATCEALGALAARVRAHGPAGATAYYQTRFVEKDRCAGAADLVLLGALNDENPQERLRRWRRAHRRARRRDTSRTSSSGAASGDTASATPAGIGALGTWVDPQEEGLAAPHSPQSQARYFEEHLPPFFADSARAQTAPAAVSPSDSRSSRAAPPRVVFAYRWSDRTAAPDSAERSTPQGFFSENDPYGRRYGLRGAEGAARPALKVVRGLFTGGQRVFAFRAGEAPPAHLPWMVLLGWGLVAVLGLIYADTPRAQSMVRRYFRSRGFYRQAVREGRQVLARFSLALLLCVGVCAGLVGTAFLLSVRRAGPFVQFLRGSSGAMQGAVQTALAHPWAGVLAVAACYALSLGVWAFLLALVSRRGRPLDTGQTLMLVVWPRWPSLLLAAAAVVTTTLPPDLALRVAAVLLGLWVLAAAVAAARTLYDFALLTNLSPLFTPVLVLLDPLVLALVLAFFAVLEFLPEAAFLWHLTMRS